MNPCISVILPTYNSEDYVERAIASVLKQTTQDFELIIVDDASVDSTLARVRAIADDRIRVFANPQNLGAAATRNRAIAQAKGRWIALLDSDDWYAPQRLERLLKLAESHQADMIADNLSLINSGESHVWSTIVKESGHIVDETIIVDPAYFVRTDRYGHRDLHLGYTKPIFRKDFLTQQGLHYDEKNILTHDFWLYLSCLVAGARFVFTPESYYFQCLRSDSMIMTNSQIQRLNDDIKTSKEFLSLAVVQQNPNLTSALQAGLKRYRYYSEYYQVAEPLKKRKWAIALPNMVRHPLFFWVFIKRLPYSIWLRLKRYQLGNSLAVEKAY